MMYFLTLFCASCALFLALTSAADVDSNSKGIRSENLSPDIAPYRDGWWDRRNFKCPAPWGQFPDPDDCSNYYVCQGSRSSHKKCKRNMNFDMYRRVCLPRGLAICDNKNKGKTTRKTTPSPIICSTKPNDDLFFCPSVFGLHPHPKYCAKYFSCTIFVPSLKTCPLSQLFDAIKKECQPENTVHCGSRERPTVSTINTPTAVSRTVSAAITTTDRDSTPRPSTVPDIIEVSTTASPAPTTTSTEKTTTLVPETPAVTTARPTGPPDHNCDKDDLDCIITETGEISDWFTCPEDMGSHPHPSSDKLFIFCLNWKPSVKKCGQDLVFSKKLLTCTSP